MPDVEQATERSHLLPRLVHDRRFSAVQNEADTDSVLSTHVSKEEQLLATTSVGERLPYNDYTTIDWLHDLVGPLLSFTPLSADQHRSKTPFDLGSFTPNLAYVVPWALLSSLGKDGLRPP